MIANMVHGPRNGVTVPKLAGPKARRPQSSPEEEVSFGRQGTGDTNVMRMNLTNIESVMRPNFAVSFFVLYISEVVQLLSPRIRFQDHAHF